MIDFIMYCVDTRVETSGDQGDQVSPVSRGILSGLQRFLNDYGQGLQVSPYVPPPKEGHNNIKDLTKRTKLDTSMALEGKQTRDGKHHPRGESLAT